MAAGLWTQFVMLFWKNWQLQRRKKVTTAIEIGLPWFMAAMIILMRVLISSDDVTDPSTWRVFYTNEQFPQAPASNSGGAQRQNIKWKVAYTPNNNMHVENVIMGLLERLDDRFYTYAEGGMQGFDNETALEDFLTSDTPEALGHYGGIVFTNDFPSMHFPEQIRYKIRLRALHLSQEKEGIELSFSGSSKWFTKDLMPVMALHGPREEKDLYGGEPFYAVEGFLATQYALEMSLISYLNGEQPNPANMDDIKVLMQRFPYPPYRDDGFVYTLELGMYAFTYLMLLPSVFTITKELVLEKERKLKEMMKLMGLSSFINWFSWILKYTLFLSISILVVTIVLFIPFNNGASVLNDSGFLVTFVFLMLYAICTVCYCCMMSVFFSKANNGAMAAGVVFVLSVIVYNITSSNYGDMTVGQKLSFSWLHNVIMAYGWRLIAQYESQGTGLNWSTIGEKPSLQENLTMTAVFIVLIFDSCLYLLIMWYVEKLFPGEYGIPERFYFPCSPTYWCGGKSNKKHQSDEEEEPRDAETGGGGGAPENQYMERTVTTDLHAGIKCKHLRKQFKKKGVTQVAVEDTCLEMYQGQITALLGHNGAGKTATISMLTGFSVPTSGTATVNGHDIRTDMTNVRSSMGLCPQHDVLFDTLTVREHLEFFATLKGCPKTDLQHEVREMINTLKLEDKTDVQSHQLSGGMKRKLSVGIALIHGSKIVILDEPSSGVDPAARRQLWDILKKERKGRTMLLTTHFMDEADYLGDRIAIMATGRVKCCGSSLFLKSKYGVGYHMTIVKDSTCDSKKVQQVVKHYVPTATVESNISAELSFLLPSDMSERFEALFAYLENNKEQLKINSYGASITTMEEVFLKVGQESQDEDVTNRIQYGDDDKAGMAFVNPTFAVTNENEKPGLQRIGSMSDEPPTFDSPSRESSVYRRQSSSTPEATQRQTSQPNGATVFGRQVDRTSGTALQMRQFRAMFTKRVIHTMRNRTIAVSQILLPVLFTVLGGVILKSLPSGSDPEPRPMNYIEYMYESPQYVPYTAASAGVPNKLGEAYHHLLAANVTGVHDVTGQGGDVPGVPNELQAYLVTLGETDKATYQNEYMVAADFQSVNSTHTSVIAMYNNQAYHTSSLSLSMVTNAILQLYVGQTYTAELTNHPLPRSEQQKVEDDIGSSQLTSYIVMSQVMVGMSFLVGTFIVFLVKEKTVKAKHIQFVSGVHAFNYWFSTFLWDMINYTIPAIIVLPVFIGFDIPGTGGANIIVVWLLLMMYALAVVPMVYAFSFAFEIASNAFVWITIINMFLGLACLAAVNNLMLPGASTYEVGEGLDWLFSIIFPNYTMARGLQQMMINGYNKDSCASFTQEICDSLTENGMTNPCCAGCDFCIIAHDNVLAWPLPGVLRYFLFHAIQAVVMFAVLVVLESGILSTLWQEAVADVYEDEDDQVVRAGGASPRDRTQSSQQEDSDVMAERVRVLNRDRSKIQDSLILEELRKYYGNFRAVNRITVGIPQGECFGLLGVNGAGKTTTFKMMTGDELISSGEAYLDGYSVNNQIKEVQQRLGYCPQFDALIEQMTVEEHLYMYARLRGVVEHQIADIVEDLLDNLLLKDHRKKNSKDLSGGNKRKLSTAIALIGDPPIVFLDEPTTGMDPLARRLLWDSLNKVRASGKTLVLTSHSMEECEALCTRLAVMVNGEFKCLGSPQHLKNKFGEGYSMMARVNGEDQTELERNTQQLMEFIKEKFPGCEEKDIHQGLVHYQISQDNTTWSKAFGTMERNKEQLKVNDYSVSQTTLEQVFINFARRQEAPTFSDVSSTTKCWHCCRFVCCCGCRKSSNSGSVSPK